MLSSFVHTLFIITASLYEGCYIDFGLRKERNVPITLPKSAFSATDTQQYGGCVCVRERIIVSAASESSLRTCPVQVQHTEETILYDSTETQSLTRENVQRERKTLNWSRLKACRLPLTHSLSYSLLFPFFPGVFISALYVWFSLLFSWCLLQLLVPFSPSYLHCLSFSASCLPLSSLALLVFASLPPSHSLFLTDFLRIHPSPLACLLMAVAGVLPGAWSERPELSL